MQTASHGQSVSRFALCPEGSCGKRGVYKFNPTSGVTTQYARCRYCGTMWNAPSSRELSALLGDQKLHTHQS